MMDNISPEERLLNLIRGKKKEDVPSKPSVKYPTYPIVQKYLAFFYEPRKIVMITLGVSLIYLAVSFIYPLLGLRKIKLPQVTPEKIIESKIEPTQEIKPYEFYLEAAKGRQIFSSVSGQELGQPASGVSVDLIKDINLVGIISGENPQAVIEDKKTQKTYYVTKGQFIGEFQIGDIQEGKVILDYKGQRFELYM
jgi:type II secretory pathway component PulC